MLWILLINDFLNLHFSFWAHSILCENNNTNAAVNKFLTFRDITILVTEFDTDIKYRYPSSFLTDTEELVYKLLDEQV